MPEAVHGRFQSDCDDVTIPKPLSFKRFMSAQAINEDHFTPDVFCALCENIPSRGKDGHTACMSGLNRRPPKLELP